MKISTREKKFLIVGGGIAILVLVYYLASALVPSREGLSSTVDDRKALLQREKEMLSMEEGYKARVSQYEQWLKQDQDRLLAGESPSSAAAALQIALQEMADASGVQITSKNMQPEQKIQDNLTKISVQLVFSPNCTIDQLVQFLTAVESYDKFLRVDDLNVTGLRLQNKEQIRPTLKVTGYVVTVPAAARPAEKAPGGK